MGPRCLLVPLLAMACQPAPTATSGLSSMPAETTGPPESEGDTPETSTSSSTSGTTASGLASTSTSTDTTDTAASTFDLGSPADASDGSPAGCQGKIDFLFVISRDDNMQWIQPQLLAASPDFIATIQKKFADFDYHIMVVDGDASWGAYGCNDSCTPEGCAIYDVFPCDQLDLVSFCDELLGAGTVFPAGYNASNRPCGVDGDKRYLTRDQTDLAETFACIAQLGGSGRGWLGEALTAAVSHQLTGPGGCNDGFLRDDALLMVTFIGADWDEEGKPLGSAGTPESWAHAVVDAKHGDPESVVMLNILDPTCPPQDRTCELARMFHYSHIGSAQALDYGPDFDAATDLVEVACEGFVPPD